MENETPNQIPDDVRNALLNRLMKRDVPKTQAPVAPPVTPIPEGTQPVPLADDTKQQYEKQKSVPCASVADLAVSLHGILEKTLEDRFEIEKQIQEEESQKKEAIRESVIKQEDLDLIRRLNF